jgi:hypothetical protein
MNTLFQVLRPLKSFILQSILMGGEIVSFLKRVLPECVAADPIKLHRLHLPKNPTQPRVPGSSA